MFRFFKFTLFIISFLAGCVDPYQFVIKDMEPSLVVEGFISDKSYSDTKAYPSDGRYFSIKLSYTGDVVNHRPELISGALVELLSEQDRIWSYTETAKGIYELLDDDFKAERGEAYKLRITLNEEIYESAFEKLPSSNPPPIGEISFNETEVQTYILEAGVKKLRTVKGITPNLSIPENESGEEIYYRWKFNTMWIFKAALASVVDPGYKCWASDVNYLKDFLLEEDKVGGYKKDLFFIPTIRNERIFEDFSLLLLQYSLNKDDYLFWEEMQKQSQGSELSDFPPFNLKSNFKNLNGDKQVSGYFSVVGEQARRWYFNTKDLSYTVENTLKADCLVDYGPGPPAKQCTDCRGYAFGKATTTMPLWWRNNKE